jgi:hypothetical protein
MTNVEIEIFIQASIEKCFDAARDIDLHTKTVWKHTHEEAEYEGAFKFMRHRHEFKKDGDGTVMKDILEFQSPYGMIGTVFDYIVLKHYMKKFMIYRNRRLKTLLEAKT